MNVSSLASPHVVIVGAGITGLAAAYHLTKKLPQATVTVVEASPVAGGNIRTGIIAGIVVDEAADAFLARLPAAVDLCRELGLGDQLTAPSQRRAFVFRHGALHRFPEGLVLGVPTDLEALRASGLVSPQGVNRAARDLDMSLDEGTEGDLVDALKSGGDESVGALVRRRLGDEVFDAFVGPLLSGVNAGDADQLSLAAGAPQLAAAIRDQPSLIAGLRAQRERAKSAAGYDPDAPIFYGLRGGTQRLIDELVARLPAEALRLSTRATRVEPTVGGGFTIGALGPDGPIAFSADRVVLATPAFATADLLEPSMPTVASELRELQWADVALVTFAVPREKIDHPLDGSGFIVAEGEGLLMTACSFGSSKWAHWVDANAGRELVVLRVSAGRFHDAQAFALDDDELVSGLIRDLRATIGLRGEPTTTRVSRWPRSLPQYRPGHLKRADSWKAATATAMPGVFLAGASYSGLGIPACIIDAQHAAEQVAASVDIPIEIPIDSALDSSLDELDASERNAR